MIEGNLLAMTFDGNKELKRASAQGALFHLRIAYDKESYQHQLTEIR